MSVPAKGGAKGKDAGDEDDPIAKSLALRIAAGGVTQVIAKAPGEKGSVSKVATVATAATKLKAPITGKKGDEEEKSVDKPKAVTKPTGQSSTNLVKK
jgi:hypothetical protein